MKTGACSYFLLGLLLLQFAYKCSEGGGWHDFFAYQDHLVPWSPAKERAGGDECTRLNFRGVDDVLHVNLHAGWEAYNSAGVSQVWGLPAMAAGL